MVLGVMKMDLSTLAEQLYFTKEAADYLNISVQRLNRLVHDNKIIPIKKNPSGTVFHIDELKKRKNELEMFDKNIDKGGKIGMFNIDDAIKNEAVNFAAFMALLDCTEKKAEPLFNEVGERINLALPMIHEDVLQTYAIVVNRNERDIRTLYEKTYFAFTQLQEHDEIIKKGSFDYPVLLAQTDQAPRFLYVRGRKSLLTEARTVALVGARKSSENAKNKTRKLAKQLGDNGITVVSGLARGIDVSAHLAALESGYNTIAVIGTNLNEYYPPENKKVQLDIEKRGLVVSQFSPASKTQRWFFPTRNGVMSGLSLATIIMEASETSGALKQADYALKQGRQLLIPQSAIDNPLISWPRKYVGLGAVVVQTSADIIRELSQNRIFKTSSLTNKNSQQSTIEDMITNNEKWNTSVISVS